MVWVHGTLVHASLSAYQRFEHELSRADQEQYYREMALAARIFGTPAEAIPPTLADFRDYFEGQIAGDVIRGTEPAREIARVVLRAPLPGLMRMVLPAHRLATTEGLPPRIREEYDLHLGSLHRPLLTAAGHSMRFGTWPLIRIAGRLRPSLRISAT